MLWMARSRRTSSPSKNELPPPIDLHPNALKAALYGKRRRLGSTDERRFSSSYSCCQLATRIAATYGTSFACLLAAATAASFTE